jgi:hypothetical protein
MDVRIDDKWLGFWRGQLRGEWGARPFYERLGWSHLWDEAYDGGEVAIMALAPSRAGFSSG